MRNPRKKTQAAQIYLPMELYLEVKAVAKKEDKALAEWIRDIVKENIEKEKQKKGKFTDIPTFKWHDKPHNTSEKIDEIAYDNT